jgi:hypothetical protein
MPRVAGEEEHLGVCHEGSRAVGIQRLPCSAWTTSHRRPLSIAIQRGAIRRGAVPSSRMVGTVAPSIGATPPVSAGSGHRLMRPEKVAHMAHRLGNPVLGLLPRVDAHFGLRSETHDLHGHSVWVRRDVVRAVPGRGARAAPEARGVIAPPGVHGRRPRLKRPAAPGPSLTPA